MTIVTSVIPSTQNKSSTEPHWRGALEGLHQNLLYGWAVDTMQSGSRAVIEICFNGETIGCVIADVARIDIPGAFDGDVCHGFVADLGALAKKESGVLTARIANTKFTLPGEVRLANPPAAPFSATSQIFSDGALRLHGWAVDARDANRVVTVRAYLGTEEVAHAHANLKHAHLRSHYASRNGFSIDLPLALADGKSHDIRVVDDEGRALNGSPVTICCYADGGRSLLPENSDAPLLADVIDIYERHLPRSLGFQHYAAWSSRFERAPNPRRSSSKRAAPDALRIGVIITGSGDQDATLASLQQQQDITGIAFAENASGQDPQPFGKLLQQALEAGIDAIACIRAGDTIASHALASAAEGLRLDGVEIVYTDSAVGGGTVATPWFKPAWNPEYALATDYPLELMLTRASLAKKVLEEVDGLPANAAVFAWDLLCKVWNNGHRAIAHVPRVLYQFNTPLSDGERAMRFDAAQSTLRKLEPQSLLQNAHLPELPANFTPRHLKRTIMRGDIAVSLIIPTRDRVELLERCIASIKRHTRWPRLEIIVVDNGSTEQKTRSYLRSITGQGVRVLPQPGPFNFAALNNRAVEAASSEIVGLINNDIEALHDGWLEEILSHFEQAHVGAVGAKLLWPNGMVQHGGVLLGVGNVAAHYGNALADGDWGDHGRNQITHQVSGVTAACLFIRKADYLAAGGFDEHAFPVAFNDVDLCLKLRDQGKSIIWTPHARLLHAESASRGQEDTPQKRARAQREVDQLRKRWGPVLLNDPAYHPSLNLDVHAQAFGGLAIPPRSRAPRLGTLRSSQAMTQDTGIAAINTPGSKRSSSTNEKRKRAGRVNADQATSRQTSNAIPE